MSTWILLRAAGIGAYVMLFFSVAWGLIASSSLVKRRISKPSAIAFHQFCATTGVVLLGVHLGLLLVDRFMPFSLPDVLVPMHSVFRPVAITMGIGAMYGMVIVLVSSWLRKPLGTVWWRRLHLLAVPAFTLALAHGVFAGSDTQHPWMWGLYAATGLIVLFLALVRGLSYGYRPPRPATPPPADREPADRTREPVT
jgi:sulfoxide reductase heme-binding subunit YedZ